MRPIRHLLLGTALVTACTSTEHVVPNEAAGGTIVVAMPEPSNGLPPFIRSASDRMLVDLLYDRLADMDTTLQTIGDAGFHPRLARSWEWAPDSLSIVFHLDPRARWHDGRAVRAEDVRFSVGLMKDPQVAPQVAPLLSNVDSVSVTDSLTAVAWFAHHVPEQFYDLAYQVWIMPEHVLGAIPRNQLRTSDLARRPVGTNRFRLSRWEAGTRVELIADTANYRGRAKLDRVVMVPITDFNAGVTQLLTGQADFFEVLLPQHIARVDSSGSVRVLPYPGFGYAFFGMNQNDPKSLSRPHPIFGDPGVRRALSLAVDRQAMLRNVYGDIGILAHGPFPRTLGVADTTLRLPPHDPAAARALLDSLGWKPGADGIRVRDGRPLAFGVIVPTSSSARMSYAVLLQQQFRDVGAKMNIEQMDFGTFMQHQDARNFDAIMAAWSTDPSPSGSKQTWRTKGGENRLGYSNAVFDAQLDSALTSFDPAGAKAHMSRAYRVIVDDAPAIWLYDVPSIGGAHERIHVTGLRADGWWNSLPDWTIPPDARIDRDRIGLTTAGN